MGNLKEIPEFVPVLGEIYAVFQCGYTGILNMHRVHGTWGRNSPCSENDINYKIIIKLFKILYFIKYIENYLDDYSCLLWF